MMTLTPDIIKRIQQEIQPYIAPAFTIQRIEEYAPNALYKGYCEHCEIGDNWDWAERVFRVHFTMHDYPGPGQSMNSDCIMALPKHTMQEINTFIDHDKHAVPLDVYEIADGNMARQLPEVSREEPAL